MQGFTDLGDKCKKSFQIGRTLEAGCCEILFSIQSPNCLFNCRLVTIAYTGPYEIWKMSPFMRKNNVTFEFWAVVFAPHSSPREAQPAFLVVSSLTLFQGIQLVALEKFFFF